MIKQIIIYRFIIKYGKYQDIFNFETHNRFLKTTDIYQQIADNIQTIPRLKYISNYFDTQMHKISYMYQDISDIIKKKLNILNKISKYLKYWIIYIYNIGYFNLLEITVIF